MFNTVKNYIKRRKVIDELMALSDRELSDIGIPRSQIKHLVEKRK